MRRPTVPLVALSLALLVLTGTPTARAAQDATPAASPNAEAAPFAGPGVTFEVIAEVPAADPADGYTLQLGEIGIDPGSDGVEHTSDGAEVLTIEEGFILFELIALEGEGRLVLVDEETECPDEGCDLADFVGQSIVLGPGATVTHGGNATYSLRPFEVEAIPTADAATATDEEPVFTFLAAGGGIRISYACGGRCS